MDFIRTRALSRRDRLAVHGSSLGLPVGGITAVVGEAQAADTLSDADAWEGLDQIVSMLPSRQSAVDDEVFRNAAEVP